MRDETFPEVPYPPDHPLGHRAAIRSLPPLSAYVEQAEADVEHLAQRARVPDWVRDPAKWVTLSRAERRALERHHRKVSGRG